jgi:RimJ/RimL family protein N-acetyltransferase
LLRGDRVRLVPIDDEHIERYIQFSDDPELVSTMGWRPFAPGEKERFLQVVGVLTLPYCGDSPPLIFSMIDIEEDRPVGVVSLKGLNEARSSVELGIAVMEESFRGRGYGTEALRLARDYAFRELGVTLIGLTVFPDNVRAIRAYEKLGFKRTAVLEKSWTLPDGRGADMLLMELSRQRER